MERLSAKKPIQDSIIPLPPAIFLRLRYCPLLPLAWENVDRLDGAKQVLPTAWTILCAGRLQRDYRHEAILPTFSFYPHRLHSWSWQSELEGILDYRHDNLFQFKTHHDKMDFC